MSDLFALEMIVPYRTDFAHNILLFRTQNLDGLSSPRLLLMWNPCTSH
jgi:hypothetical protein